MEPCLLPDKPKAPKKTSPKLKLDEDAPKTEEEPKTKAGTTTRMVPPLGKTKDRGARHQRHSQIR